MTKLIVTPIDMAARGSFALRKKLFRALEALERARANSSMIEMMAAMDTLEGMIAANLATDDDTTVAEALDLCSAEEWDTFVSALLGRETVPNSKSAS
ncbi:MAG: hypothetical protein M0R22_11350 [Dehalococcoidia bacterium]|jgi:hypothetical protein|nr:hypothetical protein [Dehalococcoidia bacterium]